MGEKREKEWKEATDGIDWSKLGDNIKSFFGTDEKKPEDGAESDDNGDEKAKTEEKKEEKKDEKEKEKKDTKKKDKKEKDKPKEPKKPKVETVKVDLSSEGSRNDV